MRVSSTAVNFARHLAEGFSASLTGCLCPTGQASRRLAARLVSATGEEGAAMRGRRPAANGTVTPTATHVTTQVIHDQPIPETVMSPRASHKRASGKGRRRGIRVCWRPLQASLKNSWRKVGDFPTPDTIGIRGRPCRGASFVFHEPQLLD
jgi:hypothetical protein